MSTTPDGLAPIIKPFLDEGLVLELGPAIKSGKEATVFGCTAHPNPGRDQLAIKIYRPRTRRSFTNDSLYREGSLIHRVGGGNTRAARALLAGSRFGRQVQGFTWCGHEWEILCRLHEAGLPVPEPVHGDLSPYNVLWNGHAHRIIDFPQAVAPRFNPSAERLLVRDLQHLAQFCGRFGDVPDATEIAADMWLRFEQGEL